MPLLIAYVEERPILLLDEWAADQGPAFREFFYLNILLELQKCGKNIIAITHADRFFGVADRVLKCESGTSQPVNESVSFPELRRESRSHVAPA